MNPCGIYKQGGIYHQLDPVNIQMTNNSQKTVKWVKRLVIGAVVALLLVGIAGVLSAVVGIDYLVDFWWFDALGYGFYYWQRLLYRYAVFGSVTLLFFLIFFLNFWIGARFLKQVPAPDAQEEQTRKRRLLKKFQTGSIWFYAPLSLALSIPIAAPLFEKWERFLFFVFGRSTGVTDPFLGKDVAFYLFAYPIYTLVQRRLLLALAVSTVGLVVLYMVKNRLLRRPFWDFARGARWHLSMLVAALFGIGVWGFMLQRYALVYDTSHQSVFYGPGYVQMNVVLPLIWVCAFTLAAAGMALVVVIQWRAGYKTCAALILIFLAALALHHTDFLQGPVQTYVVKPNEIDKESPYIAKHIQATLNAYNLRNLQVRQFTHERFPSGKPAPLVDEVLRNIPVWDAESLVEVFQQLQQLRAYYMFSEVSVGRYRIAGRQQQVFLSPREIEFGNLPAGARNWINEHMTYTHGYGAVMAPASQVSGHAMTWYLHDIPPESRYGLTIKEPRIYYGLGKYNYSIAPNRAGEMDYPKGESNVLADYDGTGGVPVSSLLRKLLFAYYLGNKDIFFSTRITERSRLLFRRNILERIRHLTPYLQLDGTPYAAITAKGIYWIVDAYTTSSSYPAAAPRRLGNHSFNYIRNAVKIVVDAYNGSINLYVYDPADPVIDAYRRIYPGLFQSKDRLPDDLKAHIRYPKDYFDIQMQIYAKYHQQDTRVFYQQEDLWTFAESLRNGGKGTLEPYYVTLDLIKAGQMDFMLLLPMFPKNRDNLRAIAVAGCDPDNYGRIIIYNFPKGELVYGPAQIDALINQDPDIAEQFTLWDQAGSQVVRGKMIILPVGNSVLFIQPVYLKATSRVKIPELERVIMSEGETVVMEKSLQEAYTALKRRVSTPHRPTTETLEKPVEPPTPQKPQTPDTQAPVSPQPDGKKPEKHPDQN
jgi:uncharacterized protein